ncbi:MAG: transposase [Phycisphaerae bacterium]
MLTWTTYGTWLQGDERGYAKDGQILDKNETLEEINKSNLKKQPVKFNAKQKEIVKEAIIQEAKRINQKIFALIVYSNHIHLLVEKNQKSIEATVAIYKTAARKALYQTGLEGKIWSKGFDKRFCFNEQELKNRITYILRHNETMK